MNYSVLVIPNFKKELKKLAKKYPSIKHDLTLLIEDLEQNPKKGTPLGNNSYKIRLAIASKDKGKSGGARVITYLKVKETYVYLLSIYDKSNQENIPDQAIKELIAQISD